MTTTEYKTTIADLPTGVLAKIFIPNGVWATASCVCKEWSGEVKENAALINKAAITIQKFWRKKRGLFLEEALWANDILQALASENRFPHETPFLRRMVRHIVSQMMTESLLEVPDVVGEMVEPFMYLLYDFGIGIDEDVGLTVVARKYKQFEFENMFFPVTPRRVKEFLESLDAVFILQLGLIQ